MADPPSEVDGEATKAEEHADAHHSEQQSEHHTDTHHAAHHPVGHKAHAGHHKEGHHKEGHHKEGHHKEHHGHAKHHDEHDGHGKHHRNHGGSHGAHGEHGETPADGEHHGEHHKKKFAHVNSMVDDHQSPEVMRKLQGHKKHSKKHPHGHKLEHHEDAAHAAEEHVDVSATPSEPSAGASDPANAGSAESDSKDQIDNTDSHNETPVEKHDAPSLGLPTGIAVHPHNFDVDYDDHEEREEHDDDGDEPFTVVYPNPEPLTVPKDKVAFTYSFGYESRLPNNLISLPNKVAYVAGKVVVVHDLDTGVQTYISSHGNRGVGAIALHPERTHLAVGEKGEMPVIAIYSLPELKLIRVLKNGTQRGYSCLTFNAKGDKLASVGSDPDFMLTIWNWRKEVTMLRSKAFSSDVYRVSFAAGNDGQLTTCGAGHIRFWKMAETFTGLKLQGDIGKFGKAEISDVLGCAELPDGKVVSGSEWGNMLLWEGGKIKCEIATKGKKGGVEPIHVGGLAVVLIEDGEIVTAGADGHIRIWDLDVVDLADAPSEHDMVFTMDPQLERKVGNGVEIVSMSKSQEMGVDDELSVWYVQDRNGSVWKVDIAHSMSTKRPQQLMNFHAGGVTGVATCSVGHYMVTGGEDGTVRVYDYTKKTCEPLALRHSTESVSCIVWAPTSVDSTGRTIWAGYSDGVIRGFGFAHGEKGTSLVLQQAVKPHSTQVRSIHVAPEGDQVLSATDTALFFFVNSYGMLDPIGYFEIEEGKKISSVRYSVSGTKVLLGCTDATVIEVTVPGIGEHDTSRTYKLTGLETRSHVVISQLDKINQAKIEAAKPKKKKSSKSDVEDADAPEKDGEGNGEEESEEAEAKKAVVHPPSNITDAWYTNRGTFMVTLDGRDAEYAYECSFDVEEPTMYFPMPDQSTAAVRRGLRICNNEWLAFPSVDGSVRFHATQDFSESSKYTLHNSESGPVTSIAESFDRSFLITTGADGNIFLLSAAVHGVFRPVQKAEMDLEPFEADTADADDIVSPEHYSIEEEKQKAEADRMAMTAEEKKADVRRQIRMLRKEFEALVKENNALPDDGKLTRTDFEMDPEIAKRIALQEEARRAQYSAEMAWTLERHTLAHEKLRKRFSERVVQPMFVVKCIQSKEVVSTYRLIQPSSTFTRMSETMMENLASMKMASMRTKKMAAAAAEERERMDAQKKADADISASRADVDALKAKEKAGKLTRDEAQQLRKFKRTLRKEEWARFIAAKPDPNKVAPEDEEAVEYARTHMGDYKLKTSRDYVVPPEERVNTEIKREQIVALRRRIYDAKAAFNAYCFSVRGAKVEALEQLKIIRSRLITVLSELGEPIRVPIIPECDAEEFPERAMEYSMDSLRQFKTEYAALQKAEAEAASAKAGGGGFGGLGGGGDKNDSESQAVDDKGAKPKSAMVIEELEPSRESQSSRTSNLPRSGVLKSFAHKRLKLLANEKNQLLKKFEDIIFQFDRRVQLLLEAKRESELRIKFAEFQHVVYYQELVHLKSFDLRESKLQQRRDVKYFERRECVMKAETAAEKLKEKKLAIKELEEKAKQNTAEFSRALGENNKNERYLTKVFKKKIKRKRKEGAEDGGNDSSDESSDDEEIDSDDDDDDFDDTVAPPGCPDQLFNRILALREVRLDCEEALAEERKTCEIFKREVESCNKKEKTLTQALAAEDALLTEMQLEKQGKLNELDTAVPLRMSQILDYRDDLTLNKDLSKSLVFPTYEIENLKNRIQELDMEKSLQKEDRRKIKKEKAKLQAEKFELESIANELERKLIEIQILKFGSVVDLEALESRGDGNKKGEELLRTLRALEDECAQTLKEWDEKVWRARQEHDDVVVSSTSKISKIAKLSRKHETLSKSLTSGQDEVVTDDSERRHASLEERMRLQDTVRAQTEQIDLLRFEIAQLSRKGGRVRPPSKRTEPLPPIPNNS